MKQRVFKSEMPSVCVRELRTVWANTRPIEGTRVSENKQSADAVSEPINAPLEYSMRQLYYD
jgi:hypothetical protein